MGGAWGNIDAAAGLNSLLIIINTDSSVAGYNIKNLLRIIMGM